MQNIVYKLTQNNMDYSQYTRLTIIVYFLDRCTFVEVLVSVFVCVNIHVIIFIVLQNSLFSSRHHSSFCHSFSHSLLSSSIRLEPLPGNSPEQMLKVQVDLHDISVLLRLQLLLGLNNRSSLQPYVVVKRFWLVELLSRLVPAVIGLTYIASEPLLGKPSCTAVLKFKASGTG